MKRARARGDKVTELEITDELVVDAQYTLVLPSVFSLESRKLAIEIALAAVAYKYGVPFARSADLDKLRQVDKIRTAQELPVRVFANEPFMAAHTHTVHQHSVMCYLSAVCVKDGHW